MTISQWKRFAFFERNNLSLPQWVREDLIPISFPLYVDEEGSNYVERNISDTLHVNNDNISDVFQSGKHEKEYLSLTVTGGAAIPNYIDSVDHDNYENINDTERRENTIPKSLSPGVNGMLASLKLCTNMARQNSKKCNESDDIISISKSGELFSRALSLNHLTNNEKIKNMSMKEGYVDGPSLVLAFISNQYSLTGHVHCIDFTLRCNPVSSHSLASKLRTSWMGTHDQFTSLLSSRRLDSPSNVRLNGNNNMEEIEAMDGWRGYLNPFIYGLNSSVIRESISYPSSVASVSATVGPPTSSIDGNIGSSTPISYNPIRIVSIAVCSEEDGNYYTRIYSTLRSDRKKERNIYLACITDSPETVGVTVHRNPHLYLLGGEYLIKDITKTKSNKNIVVANGMITPKSEIYQPISKFNIKNRGKPQCVDISFPSRVVVVGTDYGIVIVYSFKTSLTKGGLNGTNKLNLLMEIPPPSVRNEKTVKIDINNSLSVAVNNGPRIKESGNEIATVVRNEYAVSSVNLVTHCESSSDVVVDANKKVISSKSMTASCKNVKTKLFITYRRKLTTHRVSDFTNVVVNNKNKNIESSISSNKISEQAVVDIEVGGGVCCFDLGTNDKISASTTNTYFSSAMPSARYDLDERDLVSSSLCDIISIDGKSCHIDSSSGEENITNSSLDPQSLLLENLIVARQDGLYTYSPTNKVSFLPIEAEKIAMCSLPPPPGLRRRFDTSKHRTHSLPLGFITSTKTDSETREEKSKDDSSKSNKYIRATELRRKGSSYILVATTDSKSGRDALDLFDINNKLVAFHVLLPPGNRALRARGVTTRPIIMSDGSIRGGMSSAIVFTREGIIVTLTEKMTDEKVTLLVQKHLYAAAISVAYSDFTYKPYDIVELYRKHAEYLYNKGDYESSLEQYVYTIGSLEPSHVIFRFLDAPKIPLLVKYLEELRARNHATPVHNKLLKTCYQKLNDTEAAERLSTSLTPTSLDSQHCISAISSLIHNPKEALAMMRSFHAPLVVRTLVKHGATLARTLPREIADIVLALCDGMYFPQSLADVTMGSFRHKGTKRGSSIGIEEGLVSAKELPACEKYPVQLFTNSFLEYPKLLRVILAHCRKKKYCLSPLLSRTLLELTLDEWNAAKRINDETLKWSRHTEAMEILIDPSNVSHGVGDYESLVIVQLAGFTDGEIMLYEKMQIIPELLEQYALEGTNKSRRQMLALSRSDPELLADVLGYFVYMTNDRIGENEKINVDLNESDQDCNLRNNWEGIVEGGIFDDIKEALVMARLQRILPPIRVVRILAGEGNYEFANDKTQIQKDFQTIPLSAALDYINPILNNTSSNINRLKTDIEEYYQKCLFMETEIYALCETSKMGIESNNKHKSIEIFNIDEYYSKMTESLDDLYISEEKNSVLLSEEFWREIDLADDKFETITWMYAKDIIQ